MPSQTWVATDARPQSQACSILTITTGLRGGANQLKSLKRYRHKCAFQFQGGLSKFEVVFGKGLEDNSPQFADVPRTQKRYLSEPILLRSHMSLEKSCSIPRNMTRPQHLEIHRQNRCTETCRPLSTDKFKLGGHRNGKLSSCTNHGRSNAANSHDISLLVAQWRWRRAIGWA